VTKISPVNYQDNYLFFVKSRIFVSNMLSKNQAISKLLLLIYSHLQSPKSIIFFSEDAVQNF